MLLSDLFQFITGTATTGDDTRDAALATIRAAIGTRFYPDLPDESAERPCASYTLISEPETTHGLSDAQPIGLYDTRIQIDILTKEKEKAQREELGQAFKVLLDGFTGTMGETPVVVMKDTELNSFEPERRDLRKVLDFIFIHN